MDFSDFLHGIRFSYVQPDEECHEYSDALDFGNPNWPEGHRRIKGILETLKAEGRESTFTIAGVVNEAIRRMPFGTFLYAGDNPFLFAAAIAANQDKPYVAVHQGNCIEFRSRLWPHFDNELNHKVESVDLRYYLKQKHGDFPIGIMLYDSGAGHPGQGLSWASHLFRKGTLIIVTGINSQVRYDSLFKWLNSGPSYETLLMARTAHNQHPTWWNGFTMIELI